LFVAAEWLRTAREVVVYTGAGISAESGIPTFRDEDGFWQRFPAEEFATRQGLVHTALHRPHQLADFIYSVLHPIAVAKPNAGHRAIADLEKHTGVTVVTQNIDNLHQEAGSTIVHEIHGMIQVGTSGTVMPAAMLPIEAKAAGAKVITIDPNEGQGDVWLRGAAATVLPKLIEAAFD
jgi:NAD-dependent SIR2 family protein deacetylase